MPSTKRCDREVRDHRIPADEGKRARHDEKEDDAASSARANQQENGWSRQDHRAFVQAVIQKGLSFATPSVIQKEMMLDTTHVNTERIKSKLQKYRKKSDRSIAQFMAEYDDAMVSRTSSPIAPLGGAAAAIVTRAILQEDNNEPTPGEAAPVPWTETQSQSVKQLLPDIYQDPIPSIKNLWDASDDKETSMIRIPIPVLSEEERHSGIGRAFAHVRGIIEALSEERGRQPNHSALQQQEPIMSTPSRRTSSAVAPPPPRTPTSEYPTAMPYSSPQTVRTSRVPLAPAPEAMVSLLPPSSKVVDQRTTTMPTFHPIMLSTTSRSRRQNPLHSYEKLAFTAISTTTSVGPTPIPWEDVVSRAEVMDPNLTGNLYQ